MLIAILIVKFWIFDLLAVPTLRVPMISPQPPRNPTGDEPFTAEALLGSSPFESRGFAVSQPCPQKYTLQGRKKTQMTD